MYKSRRTNKKVVAYCLLLKKTHKSRTKLHSSRQGTTSNSRSTQEIESIPWRNKVPSQGIHKLQSANYVYNNKATKQIAS